MSEKYSDAQEAKYGCGCNHRRLSILTPQPVCGVSSTTAKDDPGCTKIWNDCVREPELPVPPDELWLGLAAGRRTGADCAWSRNGWRRTAVGRGANVELISWAYDPKQF
jgi:hypothetical protein